jgi:hypothetical protein
MLLFVTVENKKCLSGSPIGQIEKKLYCWRSTRKVILKAKFSSSITSGDKNRAWQEIANIVNAGNSVKRYIIEIHKKWDNICATAKTEVSFDTGIHNSNLPLRLI